MLVICVSYEHSRFIDVPLPIEEAAIVSDFDALVDFIHETQCIDISEIDEMIVIDNNKVVSRFDSSDGLGDPGFEDEDEESREDNN